MENETKPPELSAPNPGVILSEWTDERESGVIDYRLVVTSPSDVPADDAWLESRYTGEDGDGENVVEDWDEEELDGAGYDLLKHLPVLVSEVAASERSRIEAALLDWYRGDTGEEAFDVAIRRACAGGNS